MVHPCAYSGRATGSTGLVALTLTYWYLVVWPWCWLAYLFTPWTRLLRLDLFPSSASAGSDDKFDLFALGLVFCVGHATFLALILTMLQRLWLWPWPAWREKWANRLIPSVLRRLWQWLRAVWDRE